MTTSALTYMLIGLAFVLYFNYKLSVEIQFRSSTKESDKLALCSFLLLLDFFTGFVLIGWAGGQGISSKVIIVLWLLYFIGFITCSVGFSVAYAMAEIDSGYAGEKQ